MKIKMQKPNKAERILAILSYWDPLKMKDAEGVMFYNYEAEEIAQSVRKNSSLATVEKLRAAIELKAELEGVELILDDTELHQVAAGILQSVKNC